MNGQTADGWFINDSLRPGMPERPIALPVKMLLSEDEFRYGSGTAQIPIENPGHHRRKRVQKKLAQFETMPCPGLERTAFGVRPSARAGSVSAYRRRVKEQNPSEIPYLRLLCYLLFKCSSLPFVSPVSERMPPLIMRVRHSAAQSVGVLASYVKRGLWIL
jgi:hypothetical protein